MPPDPPREATPADLPRLRALQVGLSSPSPALLDVAVADSPTDDPPRALVTVESRPHNDRTGEPEVSVPVGYCLVVPVVPSAGESPATGSVSVYVAELVVAASYRREGRGSALLDAVADRRPGRTRLRVTARSDDDRALEFYRANGFRVVDTLPEYYGDADGVALVRPIQASERQGRY